ncbi:MAG TPA: tetratricopeptide repeat protein [Burkholderiales bacterium]|nr:tetratricopeptide repeat protein [Burkholderiales bacterium]
MTPLEAFARAIEDDAGMDLSRACLLVAQDAYPELDVEHYLDRIARLAQRLEDRLRLVDRLPGPAAGREAAESRVIALNEFLFGELGFRGNAADYYDPRNSYLNEVIERRTGIPLTLSVLYLELGRRIGLALEGVSFPGHFLVQLRLRGGTLVLDPFSGGVPLSEAELRERLQRVIPEDAAADVPVAELPLDQFLEPATNRQILARLLRNLKGIFLERGEPERLLQVLNRMLVVQPDAAAELRDRGLVYQRLECWRPALQDLTDYLHREPDAADVAEVRACLVELAARCARMN